MRGGSRAYSRVPARDPVSEPPAAKPCVLVVADPLRVDELVTPLAGAAAAASGLADIDVIVTTGGDDTIDEFAARRAEVVVVTASLAEGDSAALLEALRAMVPRAHVAVVVIGDASGPVRTLTDAFELKPDRFVTSPVAPGALRDAVAGAMESVWLARSAAEGDRARGRWEHLPDSDGEGTAASDSGGEHDNDNDNDDDHDGTGNGDADGADRDAKDTEAGLRPATHPGGEPAPLPPPLIIRPRQRAGGSSPPPPIEAWQPGTTAALGDAGWAPPIVREPTVVLVDREPPAARPSGSSLLRVTNHGLGTPGPTPARVVPSPPPPPTPTPIAASSPSATVPGLAPPAHTAGWPVASVAPSARSLDRLGSQADGRDALELDELDELDVLEELDAIPAVPAADPAPASADDPAGAARPDVPEGRDFARQLRARMSMMAQRLFQGADAAAPKASDLAPRHDHHTEIDLSTLGDEIQIVGGVTEIESRSPRQGVADAPATAPGSWDTHVRERGLPDAGEVVRGVSDVAMLLAKMFATEATGRVAFQRTEVETVVMFDQGRPVFASSSDPADRMGGLLVREGKITAAQYERCQTVAAESGRRMGEILVDLGYLKRRELLPAVRRHVEDIVYSLFGWDRGSYQITLDEQPSAERIRLSRHPASLILEGIRRKFDRASLDRLTGGGSTVIEVADRERLGGIVSLGDLAGEERAALAAFDGQADLAQVARVASVDLADVLPLAWGLCVLGLATARRADTEVPDESAALVGETDLAIDRERVRARWQLVGEADYFALLGVRRDATAFEIRRAYQAARRDFAADTFPSDLRRELAQELDDIASVLDEAFRVLRDDRLRQTYLSNLYE